MIELGDDAPGARQQAHARLTERDQRAAVRQQRGVGDRDRPRVKPRDVPPGASAHRRHRRPRRLIGTQRGVICELEDVTNERPERAVVVTLDIGVQRTKRGAGHHSHERRALLLKERARKGAALRSSVGRGRQLLDAIQQVIGGLWRQRDFVGQHARSDDPAELDSEIDPPQGDGARGLHGPDR
ncbi:MAG: hypothetical protein HYV09_40885 [Deltaproteobacteria bacterium]|nr:hypothetical protein [Deltaproteobacteria bacterium]